jgi:hypothetical protein
VDTHIAILLMLTSVEAQSGCHTTCKRCGFMWRLIGISAFVGTSFGLLIAAWHPQIMEHPGTSTPFSDRPLRLESSIKDIEWFLRWALSDPLLQLRPNRNMKASVKPFVDSTTRLLKIDLSASNPFVENWPTAGQPALCVNNGGQLCICLGVVHDAEKHRYCRILNALGAIDLIPLSTFLSSGYHLAWRPTGIAKESPTVSVAGLGFTIDRPYHDFGLINRDGTESVALTVHNVSSKDLFLGELSASCSCVELEPVDTPYRLLPGKSLVLHARLKLNQATSLVHNIHFTVFSDLPSRPVPADFKIFGSSFAIAELQPTSVDFGMITNTADEPVRTISLTETHWDPFAFTHVASKGLLQIALDVKTVDRPEGLRQYLITCRPQITSVHPGTYTGSIVLATTSARHQSYEVPYVLQVAAPVELIPPMLSFGHVRLGEVREYDCIIRGRTPLKALKIELAHVPTTCRVTTQRRSIDGAITLHLQQRFSVQGFFSDDITVRTSVDSRESTTLTLQIRALVSHN